MVLGGNEANHDSASPLGARDCNSPVRPAMRLRSHGGRCIPDPWLGQLAFVLPLVCGSKTRGLSFPVTERPEGWRNGYGKRPVATGTEARAGTKEGVVRYILMASLALVVLLFIVAYGLFS